MENALSGEYEAAMYNEHIIQDIKESVHNAVVDDGRYIAHWVIDGRIRSQGRIWCHCSRCFYKTTIDSIDIARKTCPCCYSKMEA